VRGILDSTGLGAVVLTTPGAVSWATRGLNLPIDRAAGVDTIWVVINADSACLITTEVEAPRLREEYLAAHPSIDLVAVPWWDSAAFVAAATERSGVAVGEIATDGHPDFWHDMTRSLVAARLRLDDHEIASLRTLGHDAACAVEDALRTWTPGESDYEVAARIAANTERLGAQAPVLLVGGDDRLAEFRHPVAVGASMTNRVMVVLVASRGGQHVALTRYAQVAPDPDFAAQLEAAQSIHQATLAACTPGATTGEVLTAMADAYAQQGHPGAWSEHYQGGPIGYAQREFEIAPSQTDSPWWQTQLPQGCAVAWNPSLRGGAKDEDTYLMAQGHLELITNGGDWPVTDQPLPRPLPLVVGQ